MMRHVYVLSCDPDGGIYHYLFQEGKLTFREKTPLDRPMYAVIDREKIHVLLRETDPETHFGGTLSFEFDESGAPCRPTKVESTEGLVPCHLAVTENGRYVVNYRSGNLVKIGEKTVSHHGRGTHPTRQDGPHTHFVGTDPKQEILLCTDLGLDRIFLYDKDLSALGSVGVPAGSGARHLCFSEDGSVLYCINELASSVSVFSWNGGKPIRKKTYDAIPQLEGENTAAAIRRKGDTLYVSNRGADTISRFRIQGETLSLLDNTPCGGRSPRDFDVAGDYLICANQDSDSVTVLKLEQGRPILTGETVTIKAPLCVLYR